MKQKWQFTSTCDTHDPNCSTKAPTLWICSCAKWFSACCKLVACLSRHFDSFEVNNESERKKKNESIWGEWLTFAIWTKWRPTRATRTDRRIRRSTLVDRSVRPTLDCCSMCTQDQCTRMAKSSLKGEIGVIIRIRFGIRTKKRRRRKPFHDLSRSEIGRCGLVMLGLLCKRMTKCQPSRRKRTIQTSGLSVQINQLIDTFWWSNN